MKIRSKAIINFIEKHEALIFILLFVSILRVPSLFEPNRYADEDIYLTLGMALRRGLVFYRDIHDNKPPLIYVTAALSGGIMMFKLILMAFNLVNVGLVFALARKLIKGKWIAVGVTLLFGILSSIPLLEGNVVNAEMFMIVPTTLAVLLLLGEKPKYLLIGVLFSLAFLFKVPVAFELITILFWLGIYEAKSLSSAARVVVDKRIWLILAGFLVPICLSIIYYFLVGAGEPYVRAALLQNVGYLSSWGQKATPIYQNGLLQRGAVTLGLVTYLYYMRRKLGSHFGLVALWFSGALFGAMLSGRPYPHYLIEVLVPLLLMIGMSLSSKRQIVKITTVGLFGLLVFCISHYKFWYYQSIPYYKNFIEYSVLNKSKDLYNSFYGREVSRNEKIANYIRAETSSSDKIFVLGTEPAIYVLADRLPVGRYTVNYHINDFNGEDETYNSLVSDPPKYFVTFDNQGGNYGKLLGFLTASYIKVYRVDDGQVWLRK